VTDAPLDQALARAIEEVLEKMFFITATAAPSGSGPADGVEYVSAWLSFEGDPKGSLLLRLEAGAARSLALDFLGEDEDTVTDQRVGEVISELANMVCGAVLSRIESEVSFCLATPQIVAGGVAPGEPAGPVSRTTACSADIGRGMITVELTTEGPACLATEKSAY
jgi:CheY-specific phosphatase CheX